MCGIVGLFLKRPGLEKQLGALLATMLGTMRDRGPDSAGFAVYGADTGDTKVTVRGPGLEALAAELDVAADLRGTHAVLHVPPARLGGGARGAGTAPRDQHRRRRPAHGALQGSRPARRRREPVRPARHGRHPRRRPHPHGDRERRHHRRRPPLHHRARPMPGAQRQPVEPQRAAPQAGARGLRVRDRERHRGRGRLPVVADARGRQPRGGAATPGSATSTGSTPSWSAPAPGSPCCATRSAASRR